MQHRLLGGLLWNEIGIYPHRLHKWLGSASVQAAVDEYPYYSSDQLSNVFCHDKKETFTKK